MTDFDLVFSHIPSSQLLGPDTLSLHLDHVIDKSDNSNVTLLPENLFIQLIDTSLSEKLHNLSVSDPLMFNCLNALNGETPSKLCKCLSDWSFKEGVLSYQGQIYVPDDGTLHHNIVHSYHSATSTGLPSFLKTHQLVSTDFWRPGLVQFIHKYIEGCALCQQMKTNTHSTVPPLTPLPSSCTCSFQQISCDLITDLPIFDSFDSLLVVVNHGLTKGVILCPTKKSVSAERIANLFFHKVYTQFRLYNKIISNRGSQFASSFTKELACLIGYKLSLSTAYHPQTNGEIETYLCVYCHQNLSSWSDLIPMAEFAHNHHPHSVTSQSPFFLKMGFK